MSPKATTFMVFKEEGKVEYEFQETSGIEDFAAQKERSTAMKENRK